MHGAVKIREMSQKQWANLTTYDYYNEAIDELEQKAVKMLMKKRAFGTYTQNTEDIRQQLYVALANRVETFVRNNPDIPADARKKRLDCYVHCILKTVFLQQYFSSTDNIGYSTSEDRYQAAIEFPGMVEQPNCLADPLAQLEQVEDEAAAEDLRSRRIESMRAEFHPTQYETLRALHVDQIPARQLARLRGVSEAAVKICVRTALRRVEKKRAAGGKA